MAVSENEMRATANEDGARSNGAVSRYGDLGVATGWYRVAWGHEVTPGTVRPLSYFDREMVLYRTESNAVIVMDAYCKHLGAHLGHGGTVRGEQIVCPFHGWEWGPDGRNVSIPYAATRVRQCLTSYPVREANGIVWVWYDKHARPPQWEVPILREYSDDAFVPFTPDACRTWPDVGVHPLQAAENTADPAHIRFVHGAGVVPELGEFEAHEHVFKSTLKYVWGEGYESTWLTPNGPVASNLRAECYALGLIVTRYDGIPLTVQMTGATPINAKRSDYYTAVLISRDADDELRQKMIRHFFREVESDFPIWENMRRVDSPPLPRLESQIMRSIRTWSTQFFV